LTLNVGIPELDMKAVKGWKRRCGRDEVESEDEGWT